MTHDIQRIGGQLETLREHVSRISTGGLPILPAGPLAQPWEAASRPVSMPRLWAWTAATGAVILLLIYGGYEILERTVLTDTGEATVHALRIARGIGSALVLGTWGFLVAMRVRSRYAEKVEEDIRRLEGEVLERTADLERSRAFTEHLFDTLRDRIVVADPEGRVVKVNRVARESVPGGCTADCGDGTCRQRCRFDGHVVERGRLRRDPVSGRLFEVDRYPVPAREGEPALVLEVARDVTDAKRLEALVVHQEKMASLGVLAAGIAHDIGNPLASLSSELEMLELEDDPCRQRESLGVLREHVDRIGRALREMVDFARRRGEDELAGVDVATAVDDALRLVRHDRRMRNVRLETEVPHALPPVRVVEDHLVMVLVNLALNALDAMPTGGVLRVTAEASDGNVRVAVSDTGVGMNEEVLGRALDPLFTTKPEGNGTGLGLTVSQGVVRAAGGHMEIRSAEGEGTRVTLTLPAGAGDE